jgi:hypothetical protein
MTDTPHLGMPLIAASQSQKHVTHNQALVILDSLVQLSVISMALTSPPGSPSEGDRYVPASGATGAWNTWDLNIALYTNGQWTKIVPRRGWQLYDANTQGLYIWTGSAWSLVVVSGAIFGVTGGPEFPTIASDTLTVTKSYAVPAPESGSSDNLATINGLADGLMLILSGTAGKTITVKDGTGNLKMAGDFVMDNFDDTITFIKRGSSWLELCRSNNG